MKRRILFVTGLCFMAWGFHLSGMSGKLGVMGLAFVFLGGGNFSARRKIM